MQVPYKKQGGEIRQAVWDKTGGLCWYCGKELIPSVVYQKGMDTTNFFHVDHVNARCKGGVDDLDNLVPACRSCNSSKRYKSVEEWRHYLTWLSIGEFSESQIEWLRKHGIEVPQPPPVVFYFETIGLG